MEWVLIKTSRICAVSATKDADETSRGCASICPFQLDITADGHREGSTCDTVILDPSRRSHVLLMCTGSDNLQICVSTRTSNDSGLSGGQF